MDKDEEALEYKDGCCSGGGGGGGGGGRSNGKLV